MLLHDFGLFYLCASIICVFCLVSIDVLYLCGFVWICVDLCGFVYIFFIDFCVE